MFPIEIALPIVLFVVGFFGRGIFDTYRKRPLLRVTGAGTGVSADGLQRESHVQIRNEPGLWGVKRTSTDIRNRWSWSEMGFTLLRDPAHECRAWLRDTDGAGSAPLWWRQVGDPHAEWQQTVVIPVGGIYQLNLFARPVNQEGVYFIHTRLGGDPAAPAAAPAHTFADRSREWEVLIRYSFGRQRLKLDVKVYIEPDDTVRVRVRQGRFEGTGNL